jgi:hypothetical protein
VPPQIKNKKGQPHRVGQSQNDDDAFFGQMVGGGACYFFLWLFIFVGRQSESPTIIVDPTFSLFIAQVEEDVFEHLFDARPSLLSTMFGYNQLQKTVSSRRHVFMT